MMGDGLGLVMCNTHQIPATAAIVGRIIMAAHAFPLNPKSCSRPATCVRPFPVVRVGMPDTSQY